MDHMDRYFQKRDYRDSYFRQRLAESREALFDVLAGEEGWSRMPVIIAVSSKVWWMRMMYGACYAPT